MPDKKIIKNISKRPILFTFDIFSKLSQKVLIRLALKVITSLLISSAVKIDLKSQFNTMSTSQRISTIKETLNLLKRIVHWQMDFKMSETSPEQSINTKKPLKLNQITFLYHTALAIVFTKIINMNKPRSILPKF